MCHADPATVAPSVVILFVAEIKDHDKLKNEIKKLIRKGSTKKTRVSPGLHVNSIQPGLAT